MMPKLAVDNCAILNLLGAGAASQRIVNTTSAVIFDGPLGRYFFSHLLFSQFFLLNSFCVIPKHQNLASFSRQILIIFRRNKKSNANVRLSFFSCLKTQILLSFTNRLAFIITHPHNRPAILTLNPSASRHVQKITVQVIPKRTAPTGCSGALNRVVMYAVFLEAIFRNHCRCSTCRSALA